MVKKIIVRYVIYTLKHDSTYTPFTYRFSEKRVRRSLPSGKGFNVNIKGFIDRVDKKGAVRIVDYKTGSGEFKIKDTEALFDCKSDYNSKVLFQLYLYAYLIDSQDPVVVSPYFIKSIANKGVAEQLITMDVIREFEERLSILVSEIFDSAVPFTATENLKLCEKCPYYPVCYKEGR